MTTTTPMTTTTDCREATVVERTIHAALHDETGHDLLRESSVRLLTTRSPEVAAVTVPMLVERLESRSPEEHWPAIAAIHHLWWLSAHVMDDLIDGAALDYQDDLPAGEAIMAAVHCGMSLPSRILAARLPPSLAVGVLSEFAGAWEMSNNGQIHDLRNELGQATCSDVLDSYRDKNGAAYGMACAAAAIVARCPPDRVGLWRDFGRALGALGQFRNDQEDIVSGRDEDLHQRTATYHTTYFLERHCTAAERARWLHDLDDVLAAGGGRSSLWSTVLTPDVLDGYFATIAEMHRYTLDCLARLDVTGPDAEQLRRLADDAAAPVAGFPTAAEGR